ncbi:hypothetical protein EON82_09870 [bacterium]|nr:MAG: hypothetical protein EON82_09870 [bacterium]
MLPLLALALLQREGTVYKHTLFDGLLGKGSIKMLTPVERSPEPRLSGKKFGEPPHPWQFEWSVGGYSKVDGGHALRFDLWSQESTVGSKRPEAVVRALMRLQNYNEAKLRLQHSREFEGIVTVFLCYGGEPGGEQLVEVQHVPGEPLRGVPPSDRKLNSIYLYDLRSFTEPVEMLREVAHEYGHATLPPVGGFTEPEDWANGYLGEKLYLSYLAGALKRGELSPDDAMGATAKDLEAWTAKNVEPLVDTAAQNGPRPALLAGKSKASMDAFIGLALWTQRLYGEKTMTRALVMNGPSATTFPDSTSVAAAEPDQVTLNFPAAYVGKPVWIPIGEDLKKNRILGAQELGPRKNGWTRIKPSKLVVVRNYRD